MELPRPVLGAVSGSQGAPPRFWGPGRAEPLSRPVPPPARLIKNQINPKIVMHVILNQLEVSVRIK